MDQTEEALGYAAEGKKFAEEYTPPDVSVKDVGKFVAEMTPIVGDAMAAKEVYDELQKDEPNYYLAGALGGAALVGLFPGIGDVAAKAIRKGAREVFDVAKRVDVDMNAMGSGLGNVKLKPKQQDFKPAIDVEVDPNLEFYPDAGRLGASSRIVYDDDLVTRIDDLVDEWGMGELTPAELRKKLKPLGVTIEGNITKNRDMTSLKIKMPPSPRFPEGRVHFGMDTINPEPINSPSVSSAGNSIWSYPKQMYDSAATSINASKNAKGYNTLKERGDIKDKDLIVDIGGGRFNNLVEDAAEQGATVKVYDPFNRTPEHNAKVVDAISNGKSDMAMSHNVLNVIKEDTNISDVIKQAENAVKPGGKAHFSVYEGDSKDRLKGARQTSKGWQRFQTTDEYVPFVENVFGPENVVLKDKIITATKPIKNFNEGGMTMRNASDQTVQAFALGGDVEEFDPVSGNEVPPGSLPEEVRDDIPAQLSEGEYIVPADVVRFHGVKKFEELRSEAKMGFNTMENTGRIGGEPIGVAVMSDELPFDVSELNMEDDGEPEAPMMNKGGYMTRGYNPGGMVNPVLQSSGGVEYKDYTNAEGKTLLIPFFNGVPMSVIPEGYFLVGTQATNAESEAAASAAAKAESDRKREGDRQDERRAPGGDLYDPTPVIKMEELTGKELEKMVEDQGSMTADMINVGIGVINPIMGLFMKLGLTNSARQVKNELERRTMQSGNQQEQEYYANLLEIATQDEPGFVETVMGGIADTFSSVFQPQAKAEKIKSEYTPEEEAPESKYTGYTVAPPPEVITTELDDTPGARDDPYRNNPLVPTSRFDGDAEQYRSYGAGSRTTNTITPESAPVITDASNSGPTITKTSNKGDKADKNAAMRKAANAAATHTKRKVAEAKKELATPQEIEVIQKEGDRITKNLEDASRGMGLRLNKGGLMKKKKK